MTPLEVSALQFLRSYGCERTRRNLWVYPSQRGPIRLGANAEQAARSLHLLLVPAGRALVMTPEPPGVN